ncbi:alpha/beta hydrolase [Rhodocytophaga rosea]|uniref:Alpha/beta hydrolase n=1 Tax=Rhodocytophaga rosea TaxID=2704465 RepID=A0A6C0GHM5_9BACT|nr:alpha/beta hydrolase [Rhodocytophaga rosea]QHT67571.1 alpha/beta hydrolase [Rhodocytophaga rosea]
MKKFLFAFAVVLILLLILYLSGPKPAVPVLSYEMKTLPLTLTTLEENINRTEQAVKEIKKDNQARIIWADSLRKQKTRYSMVYLHGFGASQAEGAPVHTQLARQFGCNLYLARLRDHGVNKPEVFADLTAENMWETARQAIERGKQLGDTVILIGTSTGAAFALYAAAHDPSIKAVIAYSPLIDFYAEATVLVDKPWGLEIMRQVMGSEYMEFTRNDSLQSQYWHSRYRLEGLVALKSFIATTMTEETFRKVKCPVFLGYYYKNETEQDNIVSVPAMLDMYEQLGTPAALKRKVAFPEAGHHVIASYIRSKDWENVRDQTRQFMEEILQMAPSDIIPKEMTTIK